MEPLAIILIVGLFVVLAVFAWQWRMTRARGMLERWARRSGFRLLSARRCWVFRGPFWWRTGKGQEVFRVTVRDDEGGLHRAYVRVGGWWWGLWSDRVDVEWD